MNGRMPQGLKPHSLLVRGAKAKALAYLEANALSRDHDALA